jgi:hypothetical protein
VLEANQCAPQLDVPRYLFSSVVGTVAVLIGAAAALLQ